MSDKAKIGAAVAGGYLLGRTKRGRLALGLALLLAGYRPSTQLTKLLPQLGDNLELGKLTGQLRGPLGVAGRKAAEAVIAAQAARLTDQLTRRTEALTDQLQGAGQTGRDTAEGARDTAEGARDTAEGAVRGVGRRARGGSADEDGAEPAKRSRSRARRDEDEDEVLDDVEYEDDEVDGYDEEEPEEDEEPARPKVRVASRRRSS